KNADIVVAAVDRLFDRSQIDAWCQRYALPLVDVGLEIRMQEISDKYGIRAARIGGHVTVSLPGDDCLWCYGIITDKKLNLESQGKGPNYIVGMQGEAQVVTLNGVLASQACSEVLNLVTYFSRRPASKHLVFDGM